MLIMGVNKLTIIPNMENEKYHLEPSLSASGAKTIEAEIVEDVD